VTASHPEIRLLAPGEAALYRNIRLEGLKQKPEAFSSTIERQNAMPLSWFAERIVRGNIFGGFAGDELLGVAGYWPQEGAKVCHVCAKVGAHLGLGERLIEAVVSHASGRIEQLQLGVASDNQAPYRLYKKTAFSEYGREMKALKQDGRDVDEILMVRFLTQA